MRKKNIIPYLLVKFYVRADMVQQISENPGVLPQIRFSVSNLVIELKHETITEI